VTNRLTKHFSNNCNAATLIGVVILLLIFLEIKGWKKKRIYDLCLCAGADSAYSTVTRLISSQCLKEKEERKKGLAGWLGPGALRMSSDVRRSVGEGGGRSSV